MSSDQRHHLGSMLARESLIERRDGHRDRIDVPVVLGDDVIDRDAARGEAQLVFLVGQAQIEEPDPIGELVELHVALEPLEHRGHRLEAEAPRAAYAARQDGEGSDVGSDVDEEIVYAIVKEVFDNFEEFKKLHPAYKVLTKESMLQGLSAPLHPGAERYYKEVGLI